MSETLFVFYLFCTVCCGEPKKNFHPRGQ